jgi:Tfp pilus assembly protein PilX
MPYDADCFSTTPLNVSVVTDKTRGSQTGFVLPVALFMLVAATILTLGMVKTNIISLRIGGASVITQETQATAELLLGNFFVRNPLDATDGKYDRGYTPCNAAGDNLTNGSVFDCRPIVTANLPANTTPTTPEIQRNGCGSGPRSSTPTQAGSKFNYNQVATGVTNNFYGSRAQVGMGVAKLVVACP